MFQTFPQSIIRSLFTVHSAMVYVKQVCRQLLSRTILVLLELSETCIVSCQNKFVKLVHLVGFIIKKFVMMHGHMNVKNEKFICGGKCQTVLLKFQRVSVSVHAIKAYGRKEM